MKTSLFQNIIKSYSEQYDIIILKGFDVCLLESLDCDFFILDKEIYENGKINLSKINATGLMMPILSLGSRKGLMCYESFIAFTVNIRNLNIFGKRFAVISNNLLESYKNPTTSNIPDYDSIEFQETTQRNELFMTFYSMCQHVDGQQMVQYIDASLEESDSCFFIDFITPITINIKEENPTQKYINISADDNSLNKVLSKAYNTGIFDAYDFTINDREKNNPGFGILARYAELLGTKIQFYISRPEKHEIARRELYNILSKVWGYSSFRNLEIYKNPDTGREIEEISQGSIIETVIQQVEAAHNDDNYSNVLLTAPTGAGKSLLFQLAAIYLAEKYNLLTIVIQPIVALMNDQVESISSLYKGAATINGTKTAEEKESVMKKIQSGEVNLLYVAPELLLSYSLSKFIGTRELGLVVVDEAHTVTTWGRDFRVDYWFLGDYLRQQRKYIGRNFVIFALTATAVYDPTGENDMVFDTISSLKMNPSLIYVGVVRRKNIVFDIQQSHINQNSYEKERMQLTAARIREFIKKDQKAIVYFPFKRTINYLFFKGEIDDISNRIGQYHADMESIEKKQSADGFKSGDLNVMCATKAFGMGIDVSDINVVYHHSVTGNLTDYVQEIGRVARNQSITGIAKIDFTGEKDYHYIRMLHGLSAIRSHQLFGVLKKLQEIYRANGEKRNMLVDPMDFSYLFSEKDDIDQKVKSCLLLISNDLQNKLNFPALIVRAKNMFSKLYISVAEDRFKDFNRLYGKYIRKDGNSDLYYILDADKLWNEKFPELSFPNFKFKLHNRAILSDFYLKFYIRIEVNLSQGININSALNVLEDFFKTAITILNYMEVQKKRLSIDDIKNMFLWGHNEMQQSVFLQSFRLIFVPETDTACCKTYTKFVDGKEIETFQLCNHDYERVKSRYLNTYRKFITAATNISICPLKDIKVTLAELLNSLGVATVQRMGGELPQVFVRINATSVISDIIRKGIYRNDILNSIYRKYEFSERIFTHFFTTKMTDAQRWDFIEDYFLGETEEKLLNNYH